MAGLFLASHGAQPDQFNNEGETPLHVASRNGMVALVKELLNEYVMECLVNFVCVTLSLNLLYCNPMSCGAFCNFLGLSSGGDLEIL